MRTILIVLDSVGIGELPDAAEFNDIGTNTLLHIKEQVPEMDLKNMNAVGLSSIDGAGSLAGGKSIKPSGAFCKLREASKGKDTTIGHWEIAGLIIKKPMPTYPSGFPREIIERFEKESGREILGNCVASGTAILDELGDEHVRTGKPIVYTSADSVFQIAAHEDVIPVEELYRMCEAARKILCGEHSVSRVIARPFIGTGGTYSRTRNRKDFSLEPPGKTMLDAVKEAGLEVAAVGKIEDIFAGKGITRSVHIQDNQDGVDKTLEFMDSVESGLIFTNLVDFDMLYGHRNDVSGYANALMDFDKRLPEIIAKLREDDILFITADHGCDPTTPGTDHTREHIPLLIYGARVKDAVNLGTRDSFADIAATVLDYLKVAQGENGNSFLKDIIKGGI